MFWSLLPPATARTIALVLIAMGQFVASTHGRVTDLHYRSMPGTTQFLAVQAYDAADNRIDSQIIQATVGGQQQANRRSWRYTYDTLMRLVGADQGHLDLSDPENPQVVAGTGLPTPRRMAWALDRLDNWSGSGGTNPAPGLSIEGDLYGAGVVTRTVDHATLLDNRIDAVTTDPGDGSGPSAQTFRYDAAGNLILDGSYLYQYDGFNRLVQVSQRGTLDADAQGEWTGSPGPWVAHFTYDALGRLIRRQAPWPEPSLSESRIRTERYFYDGVRRIQEVFTDPLGVAAPGEPLAIGAEAEVVQPGTESAAGGAGAAMLLPTTVTWTEREYIYGPDGVDEMVCQVSPATAAVVYTLLDASGSVVALVDRDGDVLEQYSYDPYGNVLAVDTLAPCPRNRVGHQGLFFDRFDAGTTGPVLVVGAELVGHNRNRTYSPELGRFLQKDPNGTALAVVAAAAMHGRALGGALDGFDAQALYGNGMSLYAYLGANPVNRTDALGLSWDPFDMVDDFLAESAGNRAAFMQRLNTGFDTTLYIGLQIAQLHPAVGAAVAAYKIAHGTAGLADLVDLMPGGAAAGVLAKASGYIAIAGKVQRGVDAVDKVVGRVYSTFKEAAKKTAGRGGSIQAHHLLEVRHFKHGTFAGKTDDVPAVVLTADEHKAITAALRQLLPYNKKGGTHAYSKEEIWDAYKQVYPADWLAKIEKYF